MMGSNPDTTAADKRVTWSENLIDIKVMTPQTSVHENLTDIVITEEEEDIQEGKDPPDCLGSASKISEKTSSSYMARSSQDILIEDRKSLEKSLTQILGTNLLSK